MNAKILIVDDSSLARRTARVVLEEMGHTVEECSDGHQAIERFFLAQPDLVVLDMVMQGMYGLDVLAKLRELNPTARVIVVTADIQRSTEAQVRAAGASGMLNKPLNRQAFSAAVACVLEGGSTWN